ncbi:MAG: glycoside hydrolase family 10 protein [Candidatus Sumerlaeia bacterium]
MDRESFPRLLSLPFFNFHRGPFYVLLGFLWSLAACGLCQQIDKKADPSLKTAVNAPSPDSEKYGTPKPGEVRALWVTRWNYKSASDIRLIMQNAAWMGCNTIYFQVRGEATCFYPSSVDPWAWELTPGGVESMGTDPGWDPLQTAIDEAHKRGLELHAYMNVLPAWQQEKPAPRDSGHVTIEHPDWLMVDIKGRRMDVKREGFYIFLNPALPEVREYLSSIFRDLAKKYPGLDGVHLDLIRYPGEVGDYSYDKGSMDLFAQYSGGKKPWEEPEKWHRWRSKNINLLVAQLARAMHDENPSLSISAAVISDWMTAVKLKHQRWLNWPELGLTDTLAPMAYAYDMERYEKNIKKFLVTDRPRVGRIVVGLWPAEKWRQKKWYNIETLNTQVRLARDMQADGIALFAYIVFFPDHKPNAWARHVKVNIFK